MTAVQHSLPQNMVSQLPVQQVIACEHQEKGTLAVLK